MSEFQICSLEHGLQVWSPSTVSKYWLQVLPPMLERTCPSSKMRNSDYGLLVQYPSVVSQPGTNVTKFQIRSFEYGLQTWSHRPERAAPSFKSVVQAWSPRMVSKHGPSMVQILLYLNTLMSSAVTMQISSIEAGGCLLPRG